MLKNQINALKGKRRIVIKEDIKVGEVLGYIFRKKLQIACILLKKSQKVGVLRTINHNVDRATALKLCKTLILSQLMYCPTVLYTLNKNKINKLQKL